MGRTPHSPEDDEERLVPPERFLGRDFEPVFITGSWKRTALAILLAVLLVLLFWILAAVVGW